MELSTLLVSALIALASMLAIDAIWLSTMVGRLYRPRIGHLMRETPHWTPAAAFYLIYIAGLSFFVLEPMLSSGTGAGETFAVGALFGLVTYATYDLTNHATLTRWSLAVTLADLVWGSVLTGAVSVVAVQLTALIIL